MQAQRYESASVRLSAHHKGRKRREPVWIGRYRVADKDSAKVLGKAWTKRSRPTEGYVTRATAEEALRRHLEGEGAKLTAAGGITFGRLADAYIASLEARIAAGDFRATTAKGYRSVIEHELRPAFGAQRVGAITRDDIARYRGKLADRGLKPSSLNQHRSVLRGIFALAQRDYGLRDNPALAWEWSRLRSATSGRIQFYTPEEVERLCEHASDEQDAAIFRTAAFTGLRMSELRGLRWRAVDFAKSLVHVTGGYTDAGGDALPKGYRVRSVPMMPQIAQTLAPLREREHFIDDEDFVFAGTVGQSVSGVAVYKRYVKAAERAGLARLRFHDLRHSFGTLAVQAFPLSDVKAFMGHADISTTMIYVHHVPQRDAAAKLGALAARRIPAPISRREVA